MRKTLLTFTLIFICACATTTTQVPEWKETAFRDIENYKKSFLTGKQNAADVQFNRAREAIASGNNLNLLAKLYLTKYALQRAALEDFNDGEFLRINRLHPVSANLAYYNFLMGSVNAKDANFLPDQYAGLIKPLRNKDAAKGLEELLAIDDPLSRLIACGVWVKHAPYDDYILKLGVNTAAEQGWKKPLWAYLNALQKYYFQTGETAKANEAKEWLELLKR
ncbi:MAG TPA: hypothetical protein P5294_10350 [Smithellaceae bacterium]|nr:hypothetical protein [Smithellaceae bacterium]HRS90079.1 hypothetical protein [Smithellaceae bacterium]HRV26929.1 hypothetical protein [Smithellaceae bacterium]